MKLCFIVDYRSAIARNWIAYFFGRQHEVHVISTYPVSNEPTEVTSFQVVPVGVAGLAGKQMRRYVSVTGVADAREGETPSGVARIAPALNAVARWVFPWVMPADAWRRRGEARKIIERIDPDIVHAMRIPAEGMLASYAMEGFDRPLILSVWGNDFTLYANENPLIGSATRHSMRRADALHTDCYRDQRLASHWGFDTSKPAVVLPGSGGVQLDMFRPKPAPDAVYGRWGLDSNRPIVFNPRNFRPKYVLNDVFFASAGAVLAKRPETQFVCVGMAGNPVAEQWRAGLKDTASARLLPQVSRPQMAELFQIADVSVSPSIHDGTPNTLLEAMACGAYPVAGDIESIREWIEDGTNGSLCDPADEVALAKAILFAIENPDVRRKAAEHNRQVIAERADYAQVMPAAEAFYGQLIARAQKTGPFAPTKPSMPNLPIAG
jgi:glycosyltransferase involved in cell wall biosynthesis